MKNQEHINDSNTNFEEGIDKESENNSSTTNESNNEFSNQQNAEIDNDNSDIKESKEVDFQDKYLRLYADFENFRKRTIKERSEMSSFLKSDVSVKFIPILDDLNRTLENIQNNDKDSKVFTAVEMIRAKFINTLSNLGITEMEIKLYEDELNPDKHEALTTLNVAEESHKGKIVGIVEKGYILNGNVIRFAKVIIGA